VGEFAPTTLPSARNRLSPSDARAATAGRAPVRRIPPGPRPLPSPRFVEHAEEIRRSRRILASTTTAVDHSRINDLGHRAGTSSTRLTTAVRGTAMPSCEANPQRLPLVSSNAKAASDPSPGSWLFDLRPHRPARQSTGHGRQDNGGSRLCDPVKDSCCELVWTLSEVREEGRRASQRTRRLGLGPPVGSRHSPASAAPRLPKERAASNVCFAPRRAAERRRPPAVWRAH